MSVIRPIGQHYSKNMLNEDRFEPKYEYLKYEFIPSASTN